MPAHNREDILIGLFWLVFETIIYAFIVSAITLRLLSVIPLIILVAILVAIILAWRRHGVRTRMLVLSQRFVMFLTVPPLMGIALGLLVVTILVHVKPYVPFLADIPFAWVEVGAGGAVFLIGIIIFEIVCWRFNRMDITASRCYYVIRKIDRLSAEEKYFFENDANFHAIRREARVLDQLARRDNACIRRRFLLRYTITPGKDFLRGLSASSLPREAELAASANKLCGEGDKRHWRAYGNPVQPLQFNKIFGSQLDDLFNYSHGFRTYDTGSPRFVTMVVKGPPGAGKSTHALQMCVSLACQGNFCMYYSLEEEREGLLKSAQNFGWDNPEEPPYNEKGEPILRGAQPQNTPRQGNYQGVRHSSFAKSRSQLKKRQKTLKKQASGETPETATESTSGVVLVSSLGGRAMSFRRRMGRLRKVWGGRLSNTGDLPEVARCVVIDSLEGFANVGLEHAGQIAVPRDELLALKDFFRDRCQMLVIVAEDDGSNKPGYVDFVADVVIQLGRRADPKTEYTILTAEVLKARNQKHALGQHQIKFISKEDIENATGAAIQIVHNLTPGIQVLPSLHYHLSLSAREETFDEHFLSTGLAGLDEMFNGDPNFDKNRESQDHPEAESLIRGDQLRLRRPSATALLGSGGTAKSMIAMNFLIEGIRENTKTLLLSFRDDEGTIINRPIAQGGGRMRFSFASPETRGAANDKVDVRTYCHQFEWTIDDIARWVRSKQRPARLPYLFTQGPASYKTFQNSVILKREAEAVQTFLERLEKSVLPTMRGQTARVQYFSMPMTRHGRSFSR